MTGCQGCTSIILALDNAALLDAQAAHSQAQVHCCCCCCCNMPPAWACMGSHAACVQIAHQSAHQAQASAAQMPTPASATPTGQAGSAQPADSAQQPVAQHRSGDLPRRLLHARLRLSAGQGALLQMVRSLSPSVRIWQCFMSLCSISTVACCGSTMLLHRQVYTMTLLRRLPFRWNRLRWL